MDCNMPGFPILHYFLEFVKLMSIELMMPSTRLIFCHLLLFLCLIFPSIRIFAKRPALLIRCPNYQSCSLTRVFSSTTVQKHPFSRRALACGTVAAHTSPSLSNAALQLGQLCSGTEDGFKSAVCQPLMVSAGASFKKYPGHCDQSKWTEAWKNSPYYSVSCKPLCSVCQGKGPLDWLSSKSPGRDSCHEARHKIFQTKSPLIKTSQYAGNAFKK